MAEVGGQRQHVTVRILAGFQAFKRPDGEAVTQRVRCRAMQCAGFSDPRLLGEPAEDDIRVVIGWRSSGGDSRTDARPAFSPCAGPPGIGSTRPGCLDATRFIRDLRNFVSRTISPSWAMSSGVNASASPMRRPVAAMSPNRLVPGQRGDGVGRRHGECRAQQRADLPKRYKMGRWSSAAVLPESIAMRRLVTRILGHAASTRTRAPCAVW